MELKELKLEEVSKITGISENQLYNNFSKYIQRLEEYSISYEGKGKKRRFFKSICDSQERIAYEILTEFLMQECNFSPRTNFIKLIHYMYLVLLNSIDEDYKYSNYHFEDYIGISEKQLIKYRRKLTEANVMKPKKVSKGIYMYLDLNNEYQECDIDLYNSFNQCILNECKNLFKSKYTVDLTNQSDYKKAKDIITNDFDFSAIDLNLDIKKPKDEKVIKELLTKNDLFRSNEYERFYKIAFYEVSKAWEIEFGIKHIKFFPNHILDESVSKDNTMISLITNAYSYILNFI